MQVQWLFQVDRDGVPTIPGDEKLMRKVAHLGYIVHTFNIGDIGEYEDIPTVCRGNLGSIKLRELSGYTPGFYCNLERLKCTSYYPYYHKHLLNKDHVFTTIGALQGESYRMWLDNCFENVGSVFVRPNSAFKTFPGRVLSLTCPTDWENLMELYNLSASELVVVSPSKTVGNEYRLVICDKTIVSYTCYSMVDKNLDCLAAEAHLLVKAKDIIKNVDYFPDHIYTMDLCITNFPVDFNAYSIRLLELNSFSCAGLYESSLNAIVHAVSNRAKIDWETSKDA